ncbi:hypothetical protein Sgri01_07240 [Streptomyces griseus]
MRRVIHLDPTRTNTLPLQPHAQLADLVGRTTHHNLPRSIHRRHRHRPGQHSLHLNRVQGDGRHRPLPRQSQQRPRAQRHHPGTVLHAQPTRHHSSRDLPLRVTDHGIGFHTRRPPDLRQGHHHRPQHRLDHIHPAQPLLVRTRQHLTQRPVHERIQRPLAHSDRPREHGIAPQQLPPHTRPLPTLAREDEDDSGAGRGWAGGDAFGRRARSHSVQSRQQRLYVLAGHHRPLLQARASRQTRRHSRRPETVHRTRRPLSPHKARELRRLSPQTSHITTRNHPRQ